MDEVIKKYYQVELDAGADRLYKDEIETAWREIIDMIEPVTDISTQNDIHSLIGDVWSDSAEVGFKAGFRAAFKFLMNL